MKSLVFLDVLPLLVACINDWTILPETKAHEVSSRTFCVSSGTVKHHVLPLHIAMVRIGGPSKLHGIPSNLLMVFSRSKTRGLAYNNSRGLAYNIGKLPPKGVAPTGAVRVCTFSYIAYAICSSNRPLTNRRKLQTRTETALRYNAPARRTRASVYTDLP